MDAGPYRRLVDQWAARQRRGADADANLFRLARQVKYAGGRLDGRELEAVGWDAKAAAVGIDGPAAGMVLGDCWRDVRTTPGENALTAAMRHADGGWEEFRVWGVEGTRAKALALVWWLHRLAPKRAFVVVPRGKIAAWLGVSDKTAGKVLRELGDKGLIRFRDGGGYRYTAGEAREAEFVGLSGEPDRGEEEKARPREERAPAAAGSKCRDCGAEATIPRYEYFKAGAPRCAACGGLMEYQGSWRGVRR